MVQYSHDYVSPLFMIGTTCIIEVASVFSQRGVCSKFNAAERC